MNISAKVEYACIAILELAAAYTDGKPIQIRCIAETNGIPSRFLVQILLQLKAAGLVDSTRGAAGGYQLARDPAEITLADVKELIDGPRKTVSSSTTTETTSRQVLTQVWRDVSDIQWEMLDQIRFSELAERVRGGVEDMYYI